MNATATDVHQTLEYRTDKWLIGWLPYALLLCLLGLAILVYESRRKMQFPGWVLLAVGAGFVAFMLYRQLNPGKPALVLSPAGLQLHVASKEVLIPWREIESVETTDLKVWTRARGIPIKVTYRDCTMVQVSRQFYDDHIFVDSVFMRGPGWDSLFIPKGGSMQIALHYEQLSVLPADVRQPIEARWRKFRGRSHPASRAEETSASSRDATAAADIARSADETGRTPSSAMSATGSPLRLGSGPFLSSPWEMIKLAVPLIGFLVLLSNALGTWETAAQQEARLEREAEAEEARQEKAERDRHKKHWDDFWKNVDRDFKRY